MEDVEIPVVGMGCAHCATKIHKAVSQLAGVAQVQVDLAKASMKASFDRSKTDLTAIRIAVQQAGYDLDLRAFDSAAVAPEPGHDCSKELRS